MTAVPGTTAMMAAIIIQEAGRLRSLWKRGGYYRPGNGSGYGHRGSGTGYYRPGSGGGSGHRGNGGGLYRLINGNGSGHLGNVGRLLAAEMNVEKN